MQKKCEYSAKSKLDMMLHIANKHAETSCTVCGDKVQNNNSLKEHIQNNHPNIGQLSSTSPRANK